VFSYKKIDSYTTGSISCACSQNLLALTITSFVILPFTNVLIVSIISV
jgi:hypothetical protein